MLTLDQIREMYPDAKDASDSQIISRLSELNRIPIEETASMFGVNPKQRSALQGINDTVVNFSNSVIGTGKAAADFVSPGSNTSKYLGDLIEQGNQTKSLQQQMADRELSQSMDSSGFMESVGGVLKYVKENPVQAIATAAGNFVGPGAAIGGAKLAATAAGATAKTIGRAGLGAGALSGAAMGGGDAAGSAYDEVYRANEGLSEAERRSLATRAAREASVVPALLGAAGGMFGAEAALARGGTKSILKTGLQEFGSEAVEEGVTQLSSNLAANRYGADVDPLKGVYGSAAMGGIMGAGTGLAVGALTKERATPSFLGGANETDQTNSRGLDSSGIGKAININEGSGISTKDMINQNVGAVERQQGETKQQQAQIDSQIKAQQEAVLKQRQADMNAALNKPTGRRIADPQTGVERDETAFDVAQRQSGNQQLAQANAQANQQKAQQKTEEELANIAKDRETILNKFGTLPILNATGVQIGTNFLGRNYFKGMEAKLNDAIDKVLEQEREKPELQHYVEMAYLDAFNNQNSDKRLTPTVLTSKIEPFFVGVESPQDVLDRIEAEIKTENGKKNKASAATVGFLENFRDNLIKEELNGQPEQQQVPARVGDVSNEGRTEEIGNGNLGLLRSDEIRSVESRGNNVQQNSQQNVGGGKTGARNITSGAVNTNDVLNAGQGTRTGQVNGQTQGLTTTSGEVSTDGRAGQLALRGDTNENITGPINISGYSNETLRDVIETAPVLWKQINPDSFFVDLHPQLQAAWVKALLTKGSNLQEISKALIEQNAPRDITFEGVFPRIIELVYGRKDSLIKRQFMLEYLGMDKKQRGESLQKLADKYGKTKSQIQKYADEAENFADVKKDALAKAIAVVAKEYNIFLEDFQTRLGSIIAYNASLNSSNVVEQDEIGQIFNNAQVEIQGNEEGGATTGISVENRNRVTKEREIEKPSEGKSLSQEEIAAYQAEQDAKEEKNAVQKQSTDEGNVRQSTSDSQALDKGNKKSKGTATKTSVDEKIKKINDKFDELEDNISEAENNGDYEEVAKLQEQKETLEGRRDDLLVQQAEELKQKKSEPKKETKAKTEVVTTVRETKKDETTSANVEAAWKALGAPIDFKDLSPAAQGDLSLQFKEKGELTPKFANEVYEKEIKQLADDSKTIEGEARIISMGDEEQVKLLTSEVGKLTEGQVSRLEKEYGNKQSSPEFTAKLKTDVLNYINKGAEAVAGAIRDIIKQIANGVMSVAIIFNPYMVSDPIKIAVPTYEMSIQEVVQKAPADAVRTMSPAAQRAYEVIYPTIKDELAKTNKFFVITDKPTAMQYVFNPDGSLLFQSKVLVAKSFGDFIQGNNNIDANKITPAGLMKLVQRKNTSSTKGYDFNTVYGVEGIENGEKYFTTLMHSVWLNEKDAAQRQQALSEEGAANSRYSFGCINVDKQTFGKILNGHEEQMNGATLFVVPDDQKNVMEFVNGKAVFSKDITRQGVTPKTQAVITKTTPKKAQQLAGAKIEGKEEGLQFSKTPETQGSTVTEVKQSLKEFINFNSNKVVKIVQSVSDLSPGLQIALSAEERVGGFVTKFGKAYLIADNIARENIRGVFMHEVGSHLGLQELLASTEIDTLVDKIVNWSRRPKSEEGILANKALQRVAAAKTDIDQYNTELLAYFIEEAVNSGVNPTATKYTSELGRWFALLLNAFRTAFRKLEINSTDLNAQDVVDLAYGAAQLVLKDNKPQFTRAEQVQFSKANPTAIRQGAEQTINKLPPAYRAPVYTIFDTLEDIAKKAIPWAAFTEDLAKFAKKYMPTVGDYVDAMKERQAIKTRYERQVEDILQDFRKLPKNLRDTGTGTVNAFLKKSTMEGKWGFQPTYLNATDKVTVDPVMEAQFKAMPKEAQAIIQKVFKHGFTTLSEMKQSVMANITTEFDALIAQATVDEDAKELASLQKEKQDSLQKYRSLMDIKATTPYAPLKRFGNYITVGRSQEMLDAEKAKNNKLVEKLQKDDSHYFVQFSDTAAQAKAIAREQEGKYTQVQHFQKDDSQSAMYGGKDVQDVFQRLRTLADDSLDNAQGAKSKKAINSLLLNLQLQLLSDQSARQSENRRKGIAGAEDDMMRSFATQGRATAHFLSTLHNTSKIYDLLRAMKKDADTNVDRTDSRRYYNEFIKRHAMQFDYTPTPFLDKAMGVTSVWMLLTNPAYYLQNSTQPWMMSLPMLAGKHDYFRSANAMTQAYKDIASVISKDGFNEKTYSKLPADVRDAIETMVNSGRIDISLESDLGRWRSVDEANPATYAVEKLRSIAQDIESINRVVTAVAAYRLEKERGASHKTAIAYADKVILDTHGDYSGFNAPRITRQGLGRLATQFRKFQLIQISLMAKLTNQAFKGATIEERTAGRLALAYTLGHTFAAAGVMGLPGFAAIAWVIGAAFGDDDEPDIPEATLRKMIGNDTLANFLLKGIPKLAGVDLSGKLGSGQMLSILPYTDVDLSRDGYNKALVAAMGPFLGGLAPKVIDGIGLIIGGNYYKGLETIAPTGLGNALKGFEIYNKGITQRNGDIILKPEEITFLDAFSQGIGLPNNTITDKTFIRQTEKNFEKFYNDRTSELKNDYIQAMRQGDADKLADIREQWKETQESRKKNGFKVQPISELFKAPQAQKQREIKIKGGINKPSLAAGITER